MLLAGVYLQSVAQGVTIGSSNPPDPSSTLDLQGSSTGFLVNRMTETQRNAIANPAIGLMIYNTTTNCINMWSGSNWMQMCGDCAFTLPVISYNSPVCEGSLLQLSATNVPGASFQWTGPNGFSSTLQNPSIPVTTPADAGVYDLQVTLNGCTANPISLVVSLNPVPQAPVATANAGCLGGTLQLFASNILGATYSWTGPNGFTSSSQNPTISGFSQVHVGNYSVTATVGGCTSLAGTVNVNQSQSGATGGTITTSGPYTIHTFTTSGTFDPGPCVTSVEYLIVAGGGGGGDGNAGGGAGGGGGFVEGVLSVSPGGMAVVVGAGGAGSTVQDAPGIQGQNSSFGGVIAIGGGRGGGYNTNSTGGNGGSGGGGGGPTGPGTAGNSTQTSPLGGTGYGNSGANYQGSSAGGGGGGAGGAATNQNGGPGRLSSISGSPVYYAGGGGGASYLGTPGTGGIGGGGNGGNFQGSRNGIPGTANTGGGGGGSGDGPFGGTGGSGIVIIRYQ